MIRQAIPKFAKFSTMNLKVIHKIEDICNLPTGDREKLSVLVETRQQLVQTQGVCALRAIINWARRQIGPLLPEACVGNLACAIALIEMRRPNDASVKVALAAGTLVRGLKYRHLSLPKAALIACLTSALVELSDELNALRVWQLSAHCHGIMADSVVSELARRGGEVEDLVPLLAQVFYIYGNDLGEPLFVSTSTLRSLLTEDFKPADLPGICLAMWVVAHGCIAKLRGAIQDGVAMLIAAQTRVFGVGPQPQLLC